MGCIWETKFKKGNVRYQAIFCAAGQKKQPIFYLNGSNLMPKDFLLY